MRYSFTDLQQMSRDLCLDDTDDSFTSLSSFPEYNKREINETISFIYRLLREYKLQPPAKTVATIANTIYYPYPAGLSKIESVVADIGTHSPPLKIIESQERWDYLQQLPITSGFPTMIFPRRDDFGIYPTPQASVLSQAPDGTVKSPFT